MTTDSRPSSNSLSDFELTRERLHRVIPGGAHTYSRGDDQFPSIAPPILSHGKGAYVWDTQGNRYLDYGMALRAVTLGYADPRVNAAAVVQIEKGVNLTRASEIELAAAELICDLIPCAEMVKFAKNGSNVTTAAVKIARAYTGRSLVCVPRQHPFFSFDDWFIGVTAVKRGVLSEQAATTLLFDYNDLDSLKALFDQDRRGHAGASHPHYALWRMRNVSAMAPLGLPCLPQDQSEFSAGGEGLGPQAWRSIHPR